MENVQRVMCCSFVCSQMADGKKLNEKNGKTRTPLRRHTEFCAQTIPTLKVLKENKLQLSDLG